MHPPTFIGRSIWSSLRGLPISKLRDLSVQECADSREGKGNNNTYRLRKVVLCLGRCVGEPRSSIVAVMSISQGKNGRLIAVSESIQASRHPGTPGFSNEPVDALMHDAWKPEVPPVDLTLAGPSRSAFTAVPSPAEPPAYM